MSQASESIGNISALPLVSVHDAVFNAGSFTTKIVVCGCIVKVHEDMRRVDICGDGAKLISDYSGSILNVDLTVGRNIAITGKLKRRQRRLFISADEINDFS